MHHALLLFSLAHSLDSIQHYFVSAKGKHIRKESVFWGRRVESAQVRRALTAEKRFSARRFNSETATTEKLSVLFQIISSAAEARAQNPIRARGEGNASRFAPGDSSVKIALSCD